MNPLAKNTTAGSARRLARRVKVGSRRDDPRNIQARSADREWMAGQIFELARPPLTSSLGAMMISSSYKLNPPFFPHPMLLFISTKSFSQEPDTNPDFTFACSVRHQRHHDVKQVRWPKLAGTTRAITLLPFRCMRPVVFKSVENFFVVVVVPSFP